jgi:hypothetical protein
MGQSLSPIGAAMQNKTEGTGDDAVTYNATSYGTCGFSPDPSSPDYTPYADVTESQVLDWVWADGALVMIAELVAFNAAFGVVKEFISNGKDLSDCFGQIGQMVNCKEDIKARQQKNKKSLFSSDAEEFMALEQIAKAEAELKDFMVYYGRAGLWDDFIIFQAKARKARLEAKNAHIQKINQRVHYAGLAVGCALVCVGLYACFTIIYAVVK